MEVAPRYAATTYTASEIKDYYASTYNVAMYVALWASEQKVGWLDGLHWVIPLRLLGLIEHLC